MDFSKRHREDELMDDVQLSTVDLGKTYDDIERANRILGGDKELMEAVMKLVCDNPKEQYSLIDVGCGNGAILRKVCTIFRERGLKIRLMGIDVNPKAIVLAKNASNDYPEITYEKVDVLKSDAPDLRADFVISTLTMHHIDEPNIPYFLKRLNDMATRGVIVSDLQRSRSAYYLFKLFSAIFIKTKIAKNDGLVSIRSGFVKKELLAYSEGLPESEHSIRSKWAFRYVWVMRKKRQKLHG